jgi:hypothetical protein
MYACRDCVAMCNASVYAAIGYDEDRICNEDTCLRVLVASQPWFVLVTIDERVSMVGTYW